MKSLTEFINESLINESFKSDIIRKWFGALMGTGLKRNLGHYWSLQWDKISDADLKELTVDEALKRARSFKNPGYILWVKEGADGSFDNSYATYGYDVIMSPDGNTYKIRLSNASAVATKAYEVLDFEKFETLTMRNKRKDAQAGATALMDYDKIRQDNITRYQNALNKAHTPDGKDFAEKIKEMTEMYKQVLDKWCAKYIQEMQVGTPSYYNVCKIIDDIHHDYSEACRYLVAMDSDKRRDPKYAMKQYQNFCDSVQELEREVQEYLNEIK